ncbi:MAG: sigma 54-interacting transcriptional regulator [Ignavibacteriae bacterium]|nr:sigma 54-interacting transcriptional regulator [Ignavibacteria bacterium]MBI3365663.1 sigma 54-interacting transcriptional regulator [Ignavibacteriota bacterium]
MEDASALRQRVAELEGLNRLAQLLLLSSALDIESVLKGIVEASLSLCRAEKASILLFEPSTKETVKTLVHQANPSESSIEHTVNMAVAGWVLDKGIPLLADNLVTGVGLKNAPDHYRRYGAILAVPLIVEGEVIGIINLINNAGGPTFDENSLRVANIIAQQSAQFISRAKLQEKLFEENERLKQELQQQFQLHGIVAVSEPMKKILTTLPILARSRATVLIQGETGTGKELVARAVHYQSDRADKPFVPINCAAIPADLVESELFGHERGAFTGASSSVMGKFELANRGTIFLDEISEMPLELQPKLLRVLEERRFFRLGSSTEKAVDVRVIAATNRNLEELVHGGKFREDLYYRINVMPILLPPLRERKEDIRLLAERFLDEFSAKRKRFSKSALDVLAQLEWRGNVRELRNTVERLSLLVQEEEISPAHLEAINLVSAFDDGSVLERALQLYIQTHEGTSDVLEACERSLVRLALHKVGGNVSEAARLLGIDRKALERRREKFSF